MAKNAVKIEPKYKVGEELTLKNAWALQISPEGVKAKVTGFRPGPNGQIVYTVEAWRPPIPVAVDEKDLTK